MVLPIAMVCAVPAVPAEEPRDADTGNAVLVVVLDGLRPEYITPELMPNLYGLGQRGVVAQRHHAVYPTVTRVNAASLSTGATPGRHGILHNTIYLPEVSAESFSSGSVAMLRKAAEITGGRLLTAVSLGEVMESAGKRLWVTGSCGGGTALLLNHHLAGHGSASARGFIAPGTAEERLLEITGGLPSPPDEPPARGVNRWAVDAYLLAGLDAFRPDATILWITDPDYTTHREGVGAPLTLEAVRHVDGEFGRLVEGIRDRDLEERINIFVTSDHGFSTLTRELDPAAAVRASGVDPERYLVVTDRPKVYVEDSDPEIIRRIVRALQRDETVGAVFTRPARPGDPYGSVPGTLSLVAVDYDHERSPDILFDAAWNDDMNEYGFPGHTTQTRYPANHGTSSPFDIDIHLVAAGPDIKEGLTSRIPTGNIDLAPTVCHLLDVPVPASMEGRVMRELLRGGPDSGALAVAERAYTAQTRLEQPPLEYEVTVRRFVVDGTEYVRFSESRRSVPARK